ncbi:hypothetical protein KHA94_21385 [Bacillus sp. FJAT-49705]|uniref:Uncharacterized protein n=1 Tax=Cytobacillus citreus TaxID=2833586 RepID=A0ABS5NZA3_9BACI|nr:hypothetical protein [Cytobacillus citreus]MBS4192698.1 hypothetical protein [Cytobacillus citreus]
MVPKNQLHSNIEKDTFKKEGCSRCERKIKRRENGMPIKRGYKRRYKKRKLDFAHTSVEKNELSKLNAKKDELLMKDPKKKAKMSLTSKIKKVMNGFFN